MSRPACFACDSFSCDGDCDQARGARSYDRWLKDRAWHFLKKIEDEFGLLDTVRYVPDETMIQVCDVVLSLRPDLAVLALTLDDPEDP